MAPAPSIIIASGKAHPQHAALYKAIKEEGFMAYWLELDLCPLLVKDPSSSIGHKCNGTDPHTQRLVMAQDGFCKVVVDIVNRIRQGEVH